jgi:hypothetical protein
MKAKWQTRRLYKFNCIKGLCKGLRRVGTVRVFSSLRLNRGDSPPVTKKIAASGTQKQAGLA